MSSISQPKKSLRSNAGSDLQTPYGLIEVNEEELSDNTFSQDGRSKLDKLTQPGNVDLCFKIKTPSQHDQKEFFRHDQGIKVFSGACDENAVHQPKDKSIDDEQLWTDSRSQEGSQVQANSSISVSRSQNQSQSNSIKPELTKEMKTLERTNKKLKEH